MLRKPSFTAESALEKANQLAKNNDFENAVVDQIVDSSSELKNIAKHHFQKMEWKDAITFYEAAIAARKELPNESRTIEDHAWIAKASEWLLHAYANQEKLDHIKVAKYIPERISRDIKNASNAVLRLRAEEVAEEEKAIEHIVEMSNHLKTLIDEHETNEKLKTMLAQPSNDTAAATSITTNSVFTKKRKNQNDLPAEENQQTHHYNLRKRH